MTNNQAWSRPFRRSYLGHDQIIFLVIYKTIKKISSKRITASLIIKNIIIYFSSDATSKQVS